MNRHFFTTALATLGLAGPALAAPEPQPVPGGRLGTLTQGRYDCESPGDAAGPAGISIEDLSFLVVNGSSYRFDGVRGTYLLTGDVVQITAGPLKGVRLHRLSSGFLRKIEDDGSDGQIRCVLSVRSVANAPYLTDPESEEDAAAEPEEDQD